jgi:acetylornithine deacetylase/succinyl-diaminopimelate desuccinylase-like protein
METRKILENLINIDSQVNKTNKDIIRYISSQFPNSNKSLFPFSYEGIDSENLIIKIKGKNNNLPVIFAGHTDTVDITEGWDTNPLSPLEKEGRLYGLGASDMKGGLACMIEAAHLLDTQPKNDIYLIFDGAEENNSQGANSLVKKLKYIKKGRVIIPEPFGKEIVYAQRGYFDLEISGLNLEQTEEVIEEIEKINSFLSSKKHELGNPFIKGTKIGENLKVERKLIPGEDIRKEYNEILLSVQSVNKKIVANNQFWNPPYEVPTTSGIVRELQQIESTLLPSLKNSMGWTEAQIFGELGQAVILGPGDYFTCHKANESIDLNDLDFFSKLYLRFMKNL